MKTGGRWLVVYVCSSLRMKEEVESLLAAEGFLVRCRTMDRSSADGLYELCTLESEAREARAFLTEKGL